VRRNTNNEQTGVLSLGSGISPENLGIYSTVYVRCTLHSHSSKAKIPYFCHKQEKILQNPEVMFQTFTVVTEIGFTTSAIHEDIKKETQKLPSYHCNQMGQRTSLRH